MLVLRRLVGITVSDVETVFWKHCESPFTQPLSSTNHTIEICSDAPLEFADYLVTLIMANTPVTVILSLLKTN